MIEKLIKQLADSPSPYNTKVCKVAQVNKDKRTVDVEPLDGTAEMFDVRLQADSENTEGVVLFPKEGSIVVVTLLNDATGYVTMFSEIDYYQIKKSDTNLRTELDNMFELMDSLLGVLTNFQLMTNMGVTVEVMPNIVLDLEKLKQKNNGIKAKIQTIIK